MTDNLTGILAIELLSACQGLDLRRPARSSAVMEALHAAVREVVPHRESDRYFGPDVAAAAAILQDDRWLHPEIQCHLPSFR